VVAGAAPVSSESLFLTVGSQLDAVDTNPGDGLCETALGNGLCTLRAAIQEANAAPDEIAFITLPAGTYTLSLAGTDEDAGATGDLDVITRGLRLEGAGSSSTVIDAVGMDRVFHMIVPASAWISGVTIANGDAHGWQGGGIFDDGNYLELDDVRIVNNRAHEGAGIFGGGEFLFSNVVLTSNQAIAGGAMTSESLGGAIFWMGGRGELRDSQATDNSADAGGGGIYMAGGRSFVVRNLTLDGNRAPIGGGLMIQSSQYSPATVDVLGCSVSGNEATGGTGDLSGRGAGVWIRGADAQVRIEECWIDGNDAVGSGGGAVVSIASVTRAASFSLIRSTISHNTAGEDSGGVHMYSELDAEMLFENVTVSGNQAGRWGGGITNSQAPVTLTNTTLVLNQAVGPGGGIWNAGTLRMANSILALNRTGAQFDVVDNCEGGVTSDGHNIDEGSDCGLGGVGDLSGTSPQLTPIGLYGGATPTHYLRQGSPAIDAGDDALCPAVDQRGTARPQDGDGDGSAHCDIGAVEVLPEPTAAVAGAVALVVIGLAARRRHGP